MVRREEECVPGSLQETPPITEEERAILHRLEKFNQGGEVEDYTESIASMFSLPMIEDHIYLGRGRYAALVVKAVILAEKR